MSTSKTQDDDHELVQDAKAGNREAFDELVVRYQERIYHFVRRSLGNEQDARDVTQEAFIKAFRNLSRFREEAAFSTWLYPIAINLATSKKRTYIQRRKVGQVSLDAPRRGSFGEHRIEPVDESDRPSDRTEQREIEERIHAAIADLDEQPRQIVVLRDLQGLRYDEIGRILEIPIGTVRSRLHRARLELRSKLEGLLE